MRGSTLLALLATTNAVDAFLPSSGPRKSRVVAFESESLFDRIPNLDKLPNPFSSTEEPTESQSAASEVLPPFDASPEGLIVRARSIIASDLGILNPDLLDEDFIWIGPTLENALSKKDYLAAGKFFALRSTFPDLDYRAHDFRINEKDPATVRTTVRVVGTMRGELRLRNKVLEPNGKQMQCPPEAISMTFDMKTGKCVKLCSGFAMDRLVGNTNGLCGVMAAATIAGEPPSEWELYPIASVVERFFGRPVSQLKESGSLLAPFPETVMIQLAKGIFASNMAADDPTLLASEFSYCTPYKGPVGKSAYLEKYAAEEFANVDPRPSLFRVDPYDPYRVWVDVQPVGDGFEGPPQAVSFTFDDDGFCTRITSGAVMDPSVGNAGGLGGAEGYKYAMGAAAPDLLTKPIPKALGRLRKSLLQPITGVAVDEYSLPKSQKKSTEPSKRPVIPKPLIPVGKKMPDPISAAEKQQARQAEAAKKEQERVAAAEAVKVRAVEEAARIAQEKAAEKAKAEQRRQEIEASKEAQARLIEKRAKNAPKGTPRETKKATKVVPQPFFAQPPVDTQASAKEDSKRLAEQQQVEREAAQKKAAEVAEQQRKAAEQEQLRKAAEQQRREAAARQAAEVEARKAAAEQKQKELAAKKAADTEARRQFDERRKADAERKRKELEARKAAQAEARRQFEEKRKAEAERKRKQYQDMMAARAEARRLQEEKRKAEGERKRKEAEARRKVAASRTMSRAKPGATITITQEAKEKRAEAAQQSLEKVFQRMTIPIFGIGSQGDDAKAKSANQKAATRDMSRAKPGATITISQNAKKQRAEEAEKSIENVFQRMTIPIFGAGTQGDKAAPSKIASKTSASSKKVAATRDMLSAKPGATIRITKEAQKKRAKAAQQSAEKSFPRMTIALFGIGDKKESAKAEPKKSTPAKPAKKGPRGVPTISRWKKNRDKSVTGLLYGSKSFSEGEKVTTSPITKGTISSGEVVTTGSGSRYFLD